MCRPPETHLTHTHTPGGKEEEGEEGEEEEEDEEGGGGGGEGGGGGGETGGLERASALLLIYPERGINEYFPIHGILEGFLKDSLRLAESSIGGAVESGSQSVPSGFIHFLKNKF